MRFTKMQGAGNDYVYINGFEVSVPDPAQLARRISDRHFGVGSDGLILIQPPSDAAAHCRMEMYNADGSRAQMCGNGIRCVAKYVHDHGIYHGQEIRVETDAGVKSLKICLGPDDKVVEAEVNMGTPLLARASIPLRDGGEPSSPAVRLRMVVKGQTFQVTAVSMGNPHAVVRIPEPPFGVPIKQWPVAELGPHFENHPWFPERVNTEFVAVRSRGELDVRVWERGSGETLACGTGACAAVVGGVINGWCDPEVVVHLVGGDLKIRWEGAQEARTGRYLEGGTVFMTGPAVEVFTGDWPG